ncbi:MAG TPA: NAD(+) diphosphatase [Dehalococcoidia bacterium]|nr:NAD(+) diphosphatase [Dehalococcoidia bacterium]
MGEIIPFAGNPLDRAANQRRDEAWLAAQFGAAGGRYLPFWRLNVLTSTAGIDAQAALHWLDSGVCGRLGDGTVPLLLGLRDGVAHFAVDLSALADPIAELCIEGAAFTDARQAGGTLPAEEAGILAQARSLLEWHTRNRFCGSCGSPTAVAAGGAMRRCTACGAEHFPGPHAVVIMVVWRGDRCLLGSGRGWGGKRYSALAGFMDHGETIEEAVAREVYEEVGLHVDQVEYHASQPWPFPMSLMIGCFAHVSDEAVTVDEEELAGVRWFSREEIRQALAAPESVDFGVPGRIAIAHHLIKAWAEQFPSAGRTAHPYPRNGQP